MCELCIFPQVASLTRHINYLLKSITTLGRGHIHREAVDNMVLRGEPQEQSGKASSGKTGLKM